MKFLIFGSTGFIGNELVSLIKKLGDEAFCVSKSGNKNAIALDISEEKAFSKIDFMPDIIVNCASRIPGVGKTSKDPEFLKELFLTNVVGAANVSNWAVRKGVSKIINCSTLVVVKKPWPTPLTEDYSDIPDGVHIGYCMSKLSQEQLMNEIVKGSKTKLLHVRLSSVYGTGMVKEGIIFNLLNNLSVNKEVKITNGENTFDFINVKDVCRSIIALAKTSYESGIINLASGNPVSLLHLVEMLKEITDSTSAIINYNSNNYLSKADIGVGKLKTYIGEVYNEFIPFEKGLKSLLMKNLGKW